MKTVEYPKITKRGLRFPYYRSIGCAHLSKQPDLSTIECTLDGQPFPPAAVDQYRRVLYFSIDQAFRFDEMWGRAEKNESGPPLKVVYEESSPLPISPEDVDTVEGIKKALGGGLSRLYQLANEREWLAQYGKNGEPMSLHEFVLFGGRMVLSKEGDLNMVALEDQNSITGETDTLPGCGDVETWESYSSRANIISRIILHPNSGIFPSDTYVCPCCKRTFNLADIKYGGIEYVGRRDYHGFFHKSCWLALAAALDYVDRNRS